MFMHTYLRVHIQKKFLLPTLHIKTCLKALLKMVNTSNIWLKAYLSEAKSKKWFSLCLITEKK